MKISTRSRYCARVLAEMASGANNVVPLGRVAARQHVSRAYVENCMAPLVKSGIVVTHRGAGGGLSLGRPASEIRLSQIINLLEGPDFVVACVNNPQSCPRSSSCHMRLVWEKVAHAILSVLDATTLQDVIDELREGDLRD